MKGEHSATEIANRLIGNGVFQTSLELELLLGCSNVLTPALPASVLPRQST